MQRVEMHGRPSAAMVSWVPHIVLPALVALAFFRSLPRVWVMAMAPIVWLQDLDYLSPGEHRVYSHNIFVPLIPLVILFLLHRRNPLGLTLRNFATRPGLPVALLLASYYLASHVLLDIFAGGVVLFWPLLNTNIFIDFEIWLNTKTNTFLPQGEAGTSIGAPDVAPMYPWLSYVDTATLALLAGVALLLLFLRWRRKPIPDALAPRP